MAAMASCALCMTDGGMCAPSHAALMTSCMLLDRHRVAAMLQSLHKNEILVRQGSDYAKMVHFVVFLNLTGTSLHSGGCVGFL